MEMIYEGMAAGTATLRKKSRKSDAPSRRAASSSTLGEAERLVENQDKNGTSKTLSQGCRKKSVTEYCQVIQDFCRLILSAE